jgi:hypothetical protein
VLIVVLVFRAEAHLRRPNKRRGEQAKESRVEKEAEEAKPSKVNYYLLTLAAAFNVITCLLNYLPVSCISAMETL